MRHRRPSRRPSPLARVPQLYIIVPTIVLVSAYLVAQFCIFLAIAAQKAKEAGEAAGVLLTACEDVDELLNAAESLAVEERSAVSDALDWLGRSIIRL